MFTEFTNLFFGIVFLAVYGIFFYYYHITRRSSLIYYSLAWLVLGIHYLLGDEFVSLLSLSIFSSLLWVGNLEILIENLVPLRHEHELKYFSLFPVLLYFYAFPKFGLKIFTLAGVMIICASVLLLIYGNPNLKKIGAVQGLFGLFTSTYLWHSIMIYLQFIAALVLAYLSIKTILDITLVEKVPLITNTSDESFDIKPGIFISEKIPKIFIEKGLVFSRKNSKKRGWFWITKLNVPNAISPTNLPKMLDIIVKYMKNAKEGGKHPIIVIDNLEYLIMENDFETILKFLSTLKDYATLHSATVFLGINLNTLDAKKQHLLKRLVEGELK